MPLPRRSAKPIDARAEASRLITALAALFTGWVLLEQVRSMPGLSEVFRFADALAIRPDPEEWTIHGFEAKRTRQDWILELSQPEKSAPFRLFCSAWSLVVPAPWKRVVLSQDELPDCWGLVEVDGGVAREVFPAARVLPEKLTEGVKAALFRAAGTRAPVTADREDVPPLREITRPRLSFGSVGLSCGHVVARPMDKVLPRSLSCLACLLEEPPDVEVLEAMLRDVDPTELDRLAAVFDARRRARGAA